MTSPKPALILLSQPEDDGILHYSAASDYCSGGRNDTGDWLLVNCPKCLTSLAQSNPFTFLARLIQTPDYLQALSDVRAHGESFGPGFYVQNESFVCIFTPLDGDIVSEEAEDGVSPWVLDLDNGSRLCLGLRLRTRPFEPLLVPVVYDENGGDWFPLGDAIPPGFDVHTPDVMFELLVLLDQTPEGKEILQRVQARGAPWLTTF